MMLYPKRVYSSIRLYADLTCRIVTGNGVVKSTENFMPTYHVHMDSLCTYHAHELTKFTKKFKNSNNEGAVKKTKFLTVDRSIVRIL
jgi:hypothetical protein